MSDQAATRAAFGIRLRDLRKDAGLTGLELAALTGMRNSKISRIEHGRQNPSEDDIRAWAIACGVARRIPELIAVHREIEQMWREHRRELRAGMAHVQGRSQAFYEGTELTRVYESAVVPGFLQTRAYALAIMRMSARLFDLPWDEAESGADARLVRQRLVTSGSNRFSFVIEEFVLTSDIGGVEVMTEQLSFLSQMTTLPNVALGIIPADAQRSMFLGEPFYVFDETEVRSGFWTGSLRTRRPDEITQYLRIFTMMHGMAVYGRAARDRIDAAITLLQTRENS